MTKLSKITVKTKYSSFEAYLFEAPDGSRVAYFQNGYYHCDADGNLGERWISDNQIRFINSSYGDLFQIADGDEIVITYDSGEVVARRCFYVDECHTIIGSNLYHICQFAEMMEHNGSKYEKAMK